MGNKDQGWWSLWRGLRGPMPELWEKLGDIPIDEDDCIEEPFEHFPAGTKRFEIWHWFEDNFNISVASLLYPNPRDETRMKIIENGGNAQMRLFTLFISYRSGMHYCGVYPSLERLHDVIGELAVENDLGNIPSIDEIKSGLEDRDSFWYEFPDSTWIDVQETSGGLVTAILDEYFEKFYLDLAARIDAKVANLQESKEAEHAK